MTISLIVLCAVMAFEALVLKAILRESAWFMRLHRGSVQPGDAMEEALGVELPIFSLPVLDTDEFVCDRDLRGRHAIFLFITRADIDSYEDAAFDSMMIGLIAHAESCLYLVCEGTHEDALWIRDRERFAPIYGEHVRVLVDETSKLRERLRITSTPSCAIFDEEGSLQRVGHPHGVANAHGLTRHAA